MSIRAQSTASRINSVLAVNEATTTTVKAPVNTAPLTPEADAAAFNDIFGWENAPGLPKYIVDLIGDSLRDKPILPQGPNSEGTVRWQLDSGAKLTPHKGVITYAFYDSAHLSGMYNRPQEGFPEGAGYSPFTEAQRAAARISMHNWDDLITPTFKEVNGSGNADIGLANTYTGPAQAWAYTPYDYAAIYSEIHPQYNAFHRYDKFVGDVWVADPRVNPSNGQLLPGFYGLQTLNHEIGHSLGLSHPGNYNFGDDTDGDGVPDPINYTTDAQYFQDSHQFTIMSYFDSYETGAQPVDWNTLRLAYPSTPMVDDVFVIQQKYGADMTTRTGNSVYGFNSSTDVWNEAMKFRTGEMATVFTIWDAGGTDTLDLSGYYTPSVIDLREGAYSSAGGWGAYSATLAAIDPTSLSPEDLMAYINANNTAAGLGARTLPADHPLGWDYYYRLYFEGNVQDFDEDFNPLFDDDGNPIYLNGGLSWKDITGSDDANFLMQQNIGIAYGAIIENAIGGHGNDRINGNQANNSFTGGDGADTFVIADYSGVLPTLTGTKTVTDISIDTITDFHTGEDKIDLTSFGHLTAADVSYSGGDLHFTANGHSYTVHLLGAAIDTTSDIIYG